MKTGKTAAMILLAMMLATRIMSEESSLQPSTIREMRVTPPPGSSDEPARFQQKLPDSRSPATEGRRRYYMRAETGRYILNG